MGSSLKVHCDSPMGSTHPLSNPLRIKVMGGPGTGKTFFLRNHVQELLEKGVAPNRILVFTHSDTAAADFTRLLGHPVPAGTLRSYCLAVLSRPEVQSYTNRVPRPMITFSHKACLRFEAGPLLKDIKNKGVFGNRRKRSQAILAWERSLDPDPPSPQSFEETLLKWLRYHRGILLGEMASLVLRYFKNHPAYPELKAYTHLVVDDYQDLSRPEQALLDLLGKDCEWAVAGDLDQSIHWARNAHPLGWVEFGENLKNVQVVTLTESRRCPGPIAQAANLLLETNGPSLGSTRLNPVTGKDKGSLKWIRWASPLAEGFGIADFTRKCLQRGYRPKDILILAPSARLARLIRAAFGKLRIKAEGFYCEKLFETEGTQKAVTLLSLLADPYDRISLRFWLGMTQNDFYTGQYLNLMAYCKKNKLEPFDALSRALGGGTPIGNVPDLLKRFEELVAGMASLQGLKGHDLIGFLFPKTEIWGRNAGTLCLKYAHPEAGPKELLRLLRSCAWEEGLPESPDSVRILALSRAKALEAKIVIVTGCVYSMIPHTNRDPETTEEHKAKLKQQRRLLYVAITRATEQVVHSTFMGMPMDWNPDYMVELASGTGSWGNTLQSSFLSDMRPVLPKSISGKAWRQGGYKK